MNKAKILHQAAMDFYDIGRAALAKGKMEIFEEYLPVSFLLDKEAAYSIQTEIEDSVWKYSYARSAAWIAIECGMFEEAKHLALLGLSGQPPTHEKYELENALKKAVKGLKNTATKKGNGLMFKGTLAAINIDEKEILIRENGKKEYKSILLPNDYDHYKIGPFIGRLVEIQAKKDRQSLILENIKLAA